ncbi:ribosome biogenesis protein SLX9 homolog [Pseudochaenichthys georgianus]|uniref:ribosome biogenesis protein SLX9 homolog n=1 Tax=Pseudochaenichthys georgianus TaxID=52239 RepID=UPI001469C94A|nr:protein FAM207A [Pseudochaenichthys georgianus]
MVGKIKHVRQKLHQEAVKLHPQFVLSPPSLAVERPAAAAAEPHKTSTTLLGNNKNNARQALGQSSFPSGIFSGTHISPEALVQTLKLEEAPHVPEPAPAPAKTGHEDKRLKTKKEKMKERRDRWMNKISSIKLAKEKQALEARRQATPVVGDMRPLADALPELFELIGPSTAAPAARRKSRKNKVPVKRPEPTDFSQMKQSQKRRFLETESSRFDSAVKTLSAKMNPLADIGEQLRKRMRQEEEQGPS